MNLIANPSNAEHTYPKFPSIARYSRDIVITEKLDGTNAQIFIDDLNENMYVGSRTRWLGPGKDDNYGFFNWCQENFDDLMELGPGHHYGEWWGQGIQRKYGLNEKRFSLFNTFRWGVKEDPPACCHVVPVLYEGRNDQDAIHDTLKDLENIGSAAAPGFMNPEGIIIYHTKSKTYYKKTIQNDDQPKSLVQ